MGRPPEVFVRPATTGIDERDICRVKVTNRDRSSRPICGHLRNASSPVRERLSGQPAPAARARRSQLRNLLRHIRPISSVPRRPQAGASVRRRSARVTRNAARGLG